MELLEQLSPTHFLAVVGSSGCGKSSLIRAGLIPALLGGFLVEERDAWQIAIMKPGDAPLRNLAAALCQAFDKAPSVVVIVRRPATTTLFPYTALFRSRRRARRATCRARRAIR